MSDYTPGPWRHGAQNGSNANNVYAVNGMGPHDEPNICSVYGIPLYRRVDEEFRDIYHQGLANARLIAAAPELLEALRDIVNSVARCTSGDVCQTSDFTAARAAIAKAEGRS